MFARVARLEELGVEKDENTRIVGALRVDSPCENAVEEGECLLDTLIVRTGHDALLADHDVLQNCTVRPVLSFISTSACGKSILQKMKPAPPEVSALGDDGVSFQSITTQHQMAKLQTMMIGGFWV